jgi:hypothetical protein
MFLVSRLLIMIRLSIVTGEEVYTGVSTQASFISSHYLISDSPILLPYLT